MIDRERGAEVEGVAGRRTRRRAGDWAAERDRLDCVRSAVVGLAAVEESGRVADEAVVPALVEAKDRRLVTGLRVAQSGELDLQVQARGSRSGSERVLPVNPVRIRLEAKLHQVDGS